MVSNEELAAMIQEGKQCDTIPQIIALADKFRSIGIIANMNVGRGEEMDDSVHGVTLRLQWFAGSLVDIVDNEGWHAVNSWLNCIDSHGGMTSNAKRSNNSD